MTKKELALKMARFYKEPGTWTRGQNAKTRHGTPVPPADPRATKFCLIGASVHILPGRRNWEIREEFLNELAQLVPNHRIAQWNDDKKRTRKQVIELLETYANS